MKTIKVGEKARHAVCGKKLKVSEWVEVLGRLFRVIYSNHSGPALVNINLSAQKTALSFAGYHEAKAKSLLISSVVRVQQ